MLVYGVAGSMSLGPLFLLLVERGLDSIFSCAFQLPISSLSFHTTSHVERGG